MSEKPSVTQRAYTLRLRGIDKSDKAWREALWLTHEAVNVGAKVFGDWLLNLRGGLDHKLAEAPVKTKNGERPPNDQERKDRRIVLALSWLSVESETGAPRHFFVPHSIDKKTGERKDWAVKQALGGILRERGLTDDEIRSWLVDCQDSLSAEIRDDAVWVNRNAAFDEATAASKGSLNREEIWDMFDPFFGSKAAYLKPVDSGEGDEDTDLVSSEERVKDLVQKAGGWLSRRFGSGQGADFERMEKVYRLIADRVTNCSPGDSTEIMQSIIAHVRSGGFPTIPEDREGLLKLISGPGYKSATRNLLKAMRDGGNCTSEQLARLAESAREDETLCREKTGGKGRKQWSDTIMSDAEDKIGFSYLQHNGPARHGELSVMLDHAARRVSTGHTWIKRAEAERRKFEEDAKRINAVPEKTKEWLDHFCGERSQTSGTADSYRIRRRAIDGWRQVVEAWGSLVCQTEKDRIDTVHALQSEVEKFGDVQLFEALANEDATAVWKPDGLATHKPLENYVAAKEAEAKKRRFKVPAYRHPDPLLHPVFCDFGESRWDIKFAVHQQMKQGVKPKNSRKKEEEDSNIHRVSMTLWDGCDLRKDIVLFWQSKLLEGDFALKSKSSDGEPRPVTRASRMGESIVSGPGPVAIMNVFEQKFWNGRLQAPRAQLNAIAKLRDNSKLSAEEKKRRTEAMKGRIEWLISFSPRLQPQGPWVDYATKNGLSIKGWPHNAVNKKREGLSRLILSRLPGLRILSVDLGHRYAAACAVWETLTAKQVTDVCHKANCAEPLDHDLYLHLEEAGKKTIYRRIGSDTLSDGSPHPAPWARLDRQFLVKLQGEKADARKSSDSERELVSKMEAELGYVRDESHKNLNRVDKLMSHAVSVARLGLRLHGDRARIAFNLTTDKKPISGGGQKKLNEKERLELLQDTLLIWHSVAASNRWKDDWAKQKWEEYVVKQLGGSALVAEQEDELTTGMIRKKRKEELRNTLQPVALNLINNPSLPTKLHVLWATHWREEDGKWQIRLRELRKWLLPRGVKKLDPKRKREIRHVGGLSLGRLTMIRSFYQVQKAFRTRPAPEDVRLNIPAKGDNSLDRFGQKALDAMERMREQRVKQLASRLIEAALGMGSENKNQWDGGKRPGCPINHGRFAPCHAVIIENLVHYRPEETRTRRENRQLMNWSAGKVKKYLEEGCELHGLHLREVPAGYTSRQDSRTGAPGIRCQDLGVSEFLSHSYLKKQRERAQAKKERERTDYEKFILSLAQHWNQIPDANWKGTSVRIPRKGGEVFVSADPNSSASKGLQADLNAAANIGLRALLDPDWPGRWWYIPSDKESFKPHADKVKGSVVPLNLALHSPEEDHASDGTQKKRGARTPKASPEKSVINLWRDPSARPIEGSDKGDRWVPYKDYQQDVERRVIAILLDWNRLSPLTCAPDEEDDIPL